VVVLDMIKILPPLGKYKYDTWRILPVKCYIDNSVRLGSCIRNVNNHQDPLRLKCGQMPQWFVQLNRGSSLLVGELALPCHCLLISSGLQSTRLHLLPLVMSVMPLEREASFWP
jgi:hypothetical protein